MVGWRHGAIATIDFGEPVSSVATGGALEVEEVTVMLGGRHLETPAARLVAVDSLARYDGSAGCCAAICSGGVVCSGDFASRATHASASAAQCEVHCSERLECTAYEARGDGGCDIWTDPAISVSYCRLPRTLCPAAGLTPIPSTAVYRSALARAASTSMALRAMSRLPTPTARRCLSSRRRRGWP